MLLRLFIVLDCLRSVTLGVVGIYCCLVLVLLWVGFVGFELRVFRFCCLVVVICFGVCCMRSYLGCCLLFNSVVLD